MEHARYRKMLERHLDDELQPSEREELFDHIATCEECRAILEAEERLADRLSRIPRLVAPSDLRAKILKDVAREREQLMHALDDESRYASAVRGRHSEQEEDEPYPYFAGSSPTRRRGRLRTIWARYSPAAALLFAVLAGLTALLTSDFGTVGPLGGVQATVRSAAQAVGGAIVAAVAPTRGTRPPLPGETALASAPPPSAPTSVEIARASPSAQKAPPKTRTGQGADVNLPDFVSGPAREMRAALHHMARAASVDLPEPAEQALPATKAIVVTASSGRDALSLDPDMFGDSLRQTAETRLNGSVTSVDQFAFEGHRYRCYTLRVSGSLFDHLVHSLEGCRAPSDNTVLRVFRDQGYNVSDTDSVVFFAASEEQLRSAAQSIRDDASRKTAEYRNVKVYVVE